MAEASVLSMGELSDRTTVARWVDELREILERSGTTGYRLDIHQDREHSRFLPSCTQQIHGLERRHLITPDFVDSSEYRALTDRGHRFKGLLGPGAHVKRGERRADIADFSGALGWLMQEARRGYSVQRYKGLGEMNPEQLWDTTMNPETRRLLRVTVEDGIAADQMFNTLMGDVVEPRRAFIEANALAVANLDI